MLLPENRTEVPVFLLPPRLALRRILRRPDDSISGGLLPCDSLSCNPLLQRWPGPHATPAFDRIRNEHYLPAFRHALREARAEVAAIAGNPGEPTFANTVEALEFSGRRLDDIGNIFFNLNEACTDDEMQRIALEVSPLLTAFGNDISLDPVLFARVRAVYDNRDSLELTVEQTRLLEKTYKGFTRGGAALEEADKETFRALTAELSQLSLQFTQNVLAATNAFVLAPDRSRAGGRAARFGTGRGGGRSA